MNGWWPQLTLFRGELWLAHGAGETWLSRVDTATGALVNSVRLAERSMSGQWITPGVLTYWVENDGRYEYDLLSASARRVNGAIAGGNMHAAGAGRWILQRGGVLEIDGREHARGVGFPVAAGDGLVAYLTDGDQRTIRVQWADGTIQDFPVLTPLHQIIIGANGLIAYGGYGPVFVIDRAGNQIDVTVTPNRWEALGAGGAPMPTATLLRASDGLDWLASCTHSDGVVLRPLPSRRVILLPVEANQVSFVELDGLFYVATCNTRGEVSVHTVSISAPRVELTDTPPPPPPPPGDEPVSISNQEITAVVADAKRQVEAKGYRFKTREQVELVGFDGFDRALAMYVTLLAAQELERRYPTAGIGLERYAGFSGVDVAGPNERYSFDIILLSKRGPSSDVLGGGVDPTSQIHDASQDADPAATIAAWQRDWRPVPESWTSIGGLPVLPEDPVMPPDLSHIVQAIHAQYPHLLAANTYETCREFTWRSARALFEADPKFGLLTKQPGENQVVIKGQAVAVDAVTYQGWDGAIDIIARSTDGKPTTPSWGHEGKRPGNVWFQPPVFDEGGTVPPPADTHKYQGGGNDTGTCDECGQSRFAPIHEIPASKVKHTYDGGEQDTGLCDICQKASGDALHQAAGPGDPPPPPPPPPPVDDDLKFIREALTRLATRLDKQEVSLEEMKVANIELKTLTESIFRRQDDPMQGRAALNISLTRRDRQQ